MVDFRGLGQDAGGSRPAARKLVTWVVTAGEAGMRSQARGLAMRVDPDAREVIVRLRWPFGWLPAGAPGLLRFGLAPGSAVPGPPWPDLVVSCGRKASRVALAIGRASGGRAVLVNAQDPLCDPARFDLVIAMAHDRATGPNVVKVLTALNEVTPERLAAAVPRWETAFGALPRPRIGVLLGGPSRRRGFRAPHAAVLGAELARLRRATGGSLIVTPSRRTTAEAMDAFRAALGDAPAWIWDGGGDNPYFGILALADRLVVTGDSVSMVSEAIATGRPVEIFAEVSRGRHRGLIATLAEAGLARELVPGRDAAPPVPAAYNESERAAAAVRALLQQRTGWVG
jgi:mitochondrial fission protein ELM1